MKTCKRCQIEKPLERNDSHFICHKTDNVCCRGDYDRDIGRTNLMRVMGRLGAVEFVPVPITKKKRSPS